MKDWKCKIGVHLRELIGVEQTKEIDSFSGSPLSRNLLKCKKCGCIKYERIDNICFITDSDKWTWLKVN